MPARRDVVLLAEQSAEPRREPDEREVVAVDQLRGDRLDTIAHVARDDAEL
jgi:hypothetical protein